MGADALRTGNDKTPALEVVASRQLPAWLVEQRASLAFTTYQTGKLFLIGLSAPDRLSIFERTFNRCMGLAADPQTLWMSSLYQLWRLENTLDPGALHDGYDRLYVPQAGYTTGDLDVHDVAVRADGRPVFVNTLFSCLATVSETHSFEPLWKPRFISKLAAEDRCHLNGLALRDGRPAYVTAVSRSDAADGWRDRRRDGGVLVDVDSNEVIAEGFSMPHSPRWHRGALYLLDSGRGVFGKLDLGTCKLEEIAFCPGYARGLAFAGDYAVIGLSQTRANPTSAETLTGLELDGALARRSVEPRAGLFVVDLRTGKLEEIAFCPGYARGLAFVGDYAVIGLSQPRGNPTSAETLTGLELDGALARRSVEPRAGLLVVDLRTGDAVHWLRLGGIVSELYDVAVLPGVKRPMALGFKTDEIRRTLRIKEPDPRG